MDLPCCGRKSARHYREHSKDKVGQKDEAASPLAPGISDNKYPQRANSQQHVQQSDRSFINNRQLPYQHHHDHRILNQISPEGDTKVVMTGNGFFVTSSGSGLMKSKSGSLPDRYAARGFRDTFVSSMTPPASSNSATSSPHHHHAIMENRNEMNSIVKESGKESVNNGGGGSGSKKWTFGGLFKRKVKNVNNHSQSPTSVRGMSTASPVSQGSMSMSLSSPSPAPSSTVNTGSVSTHPNPKQQMDTTVAKGINNESSVGTNKYVSTPTQTRHRGKLSESDVSSEDSELENESWAKQNQQPVSFKQNFLTRRLSRRKEKAAAKKKAAETQQSTNGFLKVPVGSGKLNNGKRVGSSPESLNNGNGNIFGFGTNGPWPSWEITKKVPQLQAANNYSSSGSLSLSHEGSTRGPRAAIKEAVKARAVARRESFFHDSSSEDDGEDRSRSSIQGSHSSLSSRNRRRPCVVTNNNNNYPLTKGQIFRPSADFARGSPTSPAKFDYQNNNPSPNFNRKIVPPGSPRWEARVIYTQENLESDTPFVVKLPKTKPIPIQSESQNIPSTPGYIMTTEPTSEDQQQVITAGLRVPISGQTQNAGQFITEEVHYANLPNGVNNNNNMRFRSSTPLNYPGGYNQINQSPPPPPPRRDFNRQIVPHQNNPNFYRPVSCSYLDSYQGFYNSQRNASPNLNVIPDVTSFNPDTKEYYDSHTQSQIQPANSGNYYGEQVDNTRHVIGNNNFLVPNQYPKKHMGLIRSPSEPPEIKVQYARESPIKRNASTPSPASFNYNPENFSNTKNENQSTKLIQQPVITSKLGFPVRRLQEASKIPTAQSPVHMRASEFWRKKEAEVTGNPVQPNPNHKKYMNRIRSADSSPLPLHRMRNSPVIQNSNESISSLSSFSAEAGSPHMFANKGGVNMGRKTPNPASNLSHNVNYGQSQDSSQNQNRNPENNSPGRNSGNNKPGKNIGVKNSSPKQDSVAAAGFLNSGRENTPSQSACERLKVRIPSAPSTSSETKEESKKLRSLVDLNNGKTPGRNLEDALNELEDMYKSLRLSDEDLLDRAERRDLPTPHQELRNVPLIPLPQSYQQQQAFRFESLGSVESVATGSSSGSGTNYSSDNPNRVRAPPLRRSSRPDATLDDMARRRFDNQETKPLDPRNVVSKTGSYMILSPAFSPPVSPCPPDTLPLSYFISRHEDPDLTLDDVTFRQYRKANSIRIIDPQPPFGIPLGPITGAPDTDYLHSKRSDRLRPLFKHTKNPDLVNDDIAFRNLRKDLNCENNLSKDWTPRLFSPTRDNVFTYNDMSPNTPNQRNKKLRAIRSLSANITNFIPFSDYSFDTSDIGKWNSFTDLNRKTSSNSPSSAQSQSQQQQRRASTYLQPSWVEQIEKVQTSTETLTENRNSNNKFASEPEHWEKKLPSKTVQLTPELYDPSKPRRPWTDIILDSFEKEKQKEIERIAQETAAANANANSNDINDASKKTSSEHRSQPNNNIEITEEDDDVFLDAREQSKSVSPDDRKKELSIYAIPEVSHVHSTPTDNSRESFGFSLLNGQKNRRGSWVEPRSSSSYLSASEFTEDDKRRKSWSDLPKNIDSTSSEFQLLSPVKKLFTPLPPPKKIKQINLEAFNTSTTKPINELNCLKAPQLQQPKNVQIPFSPVRGEEKLNELMDLLIREADTCGPVTSTENKTTHVNLREEEERTECIPNERVKPSISSGLTQKDILDGNTTVSLPKIPLKESQVDEPTRRRSKTRTLVLQDSGDVNVVVAPDIVTVTRKPTTRHNDSNSTEKIDNDSIADVNIIGNSIAFTTTTDPKSANKPSSIEELIDSINESLPDLEAASCAPHKSNESSLSTGSPPSIPSPRAGSPTTITLPIKIIQEEAIQKVEEFQVDNQPKDEVATTEPLLSRIDGNENVTRIDESLDHPCATTTSTKSGIGEKLPSESNRRNSASSSSNNDTTINSKAGTSAGAGTDTGMPVKKSPEVGEIRRTNERQLQEYKVEKTTNSNVGKESSPGYGNKVPFPFLRNSTSRSRSQSLIGSVSTSPTTGSELGESKKEKDKSHKRKSHLNRAFTEEPVPDNTSSFHLSPHAFNGDGECKSLEQVSSSEYNSAEPRSRKSSTSIYKVPAIPSILTNNNVSPLCKTPDNSISQLPPSSPTMKLKSSSILNNKVHTFETRKSSPVVKRDSFSDAEGVSFIKKLLQKESMVEKVPTEVKQVSPKLSPKEQGFMLKKSPSAGSYWSKFSNSQPTFLKKFFEKPDKSDKSKKEATETEVEFVANNKSNINDHEMDTSNTDPISVCEEEPLGFREEPISVAQKASFFMKLEHDQRFSKWRKNSLEISSPGFPSQKNTIVPPENRSRSSRQLTQPVTTSEVKQASNIICEENKTSPVRIFSTPTQRSEYDLDLEQSEQAEDDILVYEGHDESSRPVEIGREPSQLSLKDRVHMFDKLISVGGKAPSAAPTPYPVTNSFGNNTALTGARVGFPMYHSSSAIMSSSNGASESPTNFYATNQFQNNVNIGNNNQMDTISNLDPSLYKRRGSTSDIELSSTPKYSPIVSARNSKTRSMFVADDMSEDGEVSSGGQEVAEIISRSYENSPLARKKSWKSQKQIQATFTKEIWRRCKVNDNNWQQHSQRPQQTYKVTTNVTHKVTNANEQEIEQHQPISHPQLQSSSPPATSNLLQILTVLSSSNDELSEPKPTQCTRKVERSLGSSSTASSVSITDNNSNLNVELHQTNQVHVPHPDDESFQMFFGKTFTHSSAFSATTSNSNQNHPGVCQTQSVVDPEMNVVQRESDLLVMKKNIPLLRRKSSGKSSRNPLKALAARMDFRNQWYTDASEAKSDATTHKDGF